MGLVSANTDGKSKKTGAIKRDSITQGVVHTTKKNKFKFQKSKSKMKFRNVLKLKIHFPNGESGEKRYSCPICHTMEKDKQQMKSHLAVIHRLDNHIICAKCNIIVRKNNFKRHMIVHDPSIFFPCPVCPRVCQRSDSLKKHRLIHERKKQALVKYARSPESHFCRSLTTAKTLVDNKSGTFTLDKDISNATSKNTVTERINGLTQNDAKRFAVLSSQESNIPTVTKQLNGVLSAKLDNKLPDINLDDKTEDDSSNPMTFNVYPNLKPVVKMDKLRYDEKGLVTWPPDLRGRKVKVQAALEDLKNWEQRGQKRKRAICPPKDQETYKQKYVVEDIEKMEFDLSERVHLFYVKWEGYHHECNTWEPLEHLEGAEDVVSRFLDEKYNENTLRELAEKVNVNLSILSDEMLLSVLPGLPGEKDLRQIPDKFLAQKRLLKFLDRQIYPAFVRMMKDGKNALLTYLLVKQRERQMTRLNKWENIINKMDKSEACITVENFVDLEPPPEHFCYINDYVPTGNIEIPETPDTYCLCTECGPGIKSCCGKQDHNAFTYTLKGKMNVNPGNAIYECNKLCKCGPSCRNRVVQHGRKVPLCIFRTDNGRGWGVKVLRKIACGEFVCEYVGEVIDHEEAERRGKAYDAEGRTYLFDLDYNSRDNLYTVDAAKYGNISHFINHSCEPNLGVYATWINCLDPNLPKLALFALREVQKGEELTFDYMMNIDEPIIKPKTPEKGGRQKLDTPEKGTLEGSRPTCKCAADTCRRYLF